MIGEFIPLKWRNSNSSGIRIKSSINKKSLRLFNTSKGIRTRKGRKPYLILRKKRNENLELYIYDSKSKPPQGTISFNDSIIKDGKYSFWYTIGSNVRRNLEFENRSGKLKGFFVFTNRDSNVEMNPVFKRYDE